MVERASRGTVAVLFGREDRGLSNQALDLCNRVAIVPTLPEYKSLNLAQAVLILAYEIFLAAHDAAELPRGRRATEPATSAASWRRPTRSSSAASTASPSSPGAHPRG